MIFLFRLLRFVNRHIERIRYAWFLRQFVWAGKSRHKRLELGENVIFTVPVRGDGLGSVVIGKQNSFGCPVAIRMGKGDILLQARARNAEISIGESNEFSNNIAIVANERITIGDRCRIGDQVVILDCDFHEVAPETRNRSHGLSAPVTIGNNVWLGSRVMVLKGVTIGDNSVISAMSIVNKSIPANCVAAGFPARVVRFFDCSK